jgi:hypothetical protein
MLTELELPFVFIVHSLGGIILKDVRESFTERRYVLIRLGPSTIR